METKLTGTWARDDLPDASVSTDHYGHMGSMYFPAVDGYRDAAVDWLNAHHPKPVPGMLWATKADADRWRRAHSIVEQERDQARERWKKWEYEAGEWKARAEAAEARTTPAVTKADIEKAVAEWVDDAPEIVNEVWSLVSGADPAVHVVRESDIAAPAVTRDDIDRALINVTSNAMNYPTPAQILGKDTEPLRRKCVDAICDLLCIEADQGVDPMEAGQALWEAVWGHKHPPSAWFEIGQGLREEYALIEAHIARQEASDE